jgi:glutamine---fructose-6-phosphate transaminase (isomerizing)
MCSIFGFIANPNGQIDLSIVRGIVEANIQRGPHAFGFAWIDDAGRLRSYRQAGRLTCFLPLLRMLADARLMVGHLRWATQGHPGDNVNNHPHPVDGGWLVHNGIVSNYDALRQRHDRRVHLSSECDSEVIGSLIEAADVSTLAGRCKWAINQTSGPLAVLSLWSRPATMLVARRGNPLHRGETADGMYLASLADALPGDVKPVGENGMTLYKLRGGKPIGDWHRLMSPARASFQRPGSRGGAYRGG